MSRLGRYGIFLEKEAGNGRADIVMIRRNPAYPDIVLELKKTRSSDPQVLRNRSEEALSRIRGRPCYRQMTGRVLLWGIRFHGKDLGIPFEEALPGGGGTPSDRAAPALPIYPVRRCRHPCSQQVSRGRGPSPSPRRTPPPHWAAAR